MTTLDLTRVAAALDAATNGLGMELSVDARARIFAAIETKTGVNASARSANAWANARNVIVSDRDGGVTLWQAVAARFGEWYARPSVVPGGYSIVSALEAVNQKEEAQ
jgi:hypothetical protein